MTDILTRKAIPSSMDEMITRFDDLWKSYLASPEYMDKIRLAREIEIDATGEDNDNLFRQIDQKGVKI